MGTVDFCFRVQNYIRASKQEHFAIMSAADVAAVAVEAKDEVKEIVKEVEHLSLAEPKEETEKPETNATDEESPKEEEKVEKEKKKEEEKVEEKTEETPA